MLFKMATNNEAWPTTTVLPDDVGINPATFYKLQGKTTMSAPRISMSYFLMVQGVKNKYLQDIPFNEPCDRIYFRNMKLY